MRRGRRVITLLAVLLALAGCALPNDDAPPHYSGTPWNPSSAALRAVTACGDPVPGRAYDVGQLNGWMTALQGFPLWQAADVGASTRLADGRVLWAFGDTLRAASAPSRFAANSLLVTSDLCTTQVVARSAGSVIADSPPTVCWPSSAMAVPDASGGSGDSGDSGSSGDSGDSVYVACSRVRRGHSLLDFAVTGTSIARFAAPRGGTPVAGRVVQVPSSASITWGSAMLHDGASVYVYGTRAGGSPTQGRSLYAARTTPTHVQDPGEWTFWNGVTWAPDAGSAAPVLSAAQGDTVSQALSVLRVRSSYVAVSMRGGDLHQEVGVWTAPAPQGPWSLVSSTPTPAPGPGAIVYQPLAHPELPLTDGKLAVSVSRTATSPAGIVRDPRRSRPVFLEVPMP